MVRGVVARGRGEPVSVETVVVPDPGPGEVVVAVQACGVCHTDLHYREGAIEDAFPFLLGHEAAGTVEAVGDGVTAVAPGDYVVIAWRSPCGTCRSCRRGRPWYCFDSRNATQPMTLADGTPLKAAIGIGAFSDLCLVDAGQAGRLAAEHLLATLPHRVLVRFDVDQLYDYRARRPPDRALPVARDVLPGRLLQVRGQLPADDPRRRDFVRAAQRGLLLHRDGGGRRQRRRQARPGAGVWLLRLRRPARRLRRPARRLRRLDRGVRPLQLRFL